MVSLEATPTKTVLDALAMLHGRESVDFGHNTGRVVYPIRVFMPYGQDTTMQPSYSARLPCPFTLSSASCSLLHRRQQLLQADYVASAPRYIYLLHFRRPGFDPLTLARMPHRDIYLILCGVLCEVASCVPCQR